jgi:hypothetical protein
MAPRQRVNFPPIARKIVLDTDPRDVATSEINASQHVELAAVHIDTQVVDAPRPVGLSQEPLQ